MVIEKAVQFCLDGWIPFLPQQLSEIETRLRSGYYADRRGDLISDISRDFGLYSYVLFHAVEKYGKTDLKTDIMFEISDSAILGILSDLGNHSKINSIKNVNLEHGELIKYLLVSGVSADRISPDRISRQVLTLQQMGLALLSFNYPTAYKRALVKVKENKINIYEALESQLGFKPRDLQQRLSEMLRLTTDSTKLVFNQVDSPILHRVSIADSLGKLSFKSAFPHLQDDFEQIVIDASNAFNGNALEIINEISRDVLANFRFINPGIFDSALRPNRVSDRAHLRYVESRINHNQFFHELDKPLQEELLKVYEISDPQVVSTLALSQYSTAVVVRFGFERGCFFLSNRAHEKFSPRIRLGNATLADFIELLMHQNPHQNITLTLREAMNVVDPILVKSVHDAKGRSFVVAHVGSQGKKVGALYLEMSKNTVANIANREIMTRFLALRECLKDLLKLDE